MGDDVAMPEQAMDSNKEQVEQHTEFLFISGIRFTLNKANQDDSGSYSYNGETFNSIREFENHIRAAGVEMQESIFEGLKASGFKEPDKIESYFIKDVKDDKDGGPGEVERYIVVGLKIGTVNTEHVFNFVPRQTPSDTKFKKEVAKIIKERQDFSYDEIKSGVFMIKNRTYSV